MSKRLLLEGSNSCEDFEWEDICEYLTEIMQRKNADGYWTASMRNFGWRGVDGEKDTFQAKTGEELLRSILPNCACNFAVYHHGRTGIAINNAHHDSPTWEEWYYVMKAKEEV